MCLTPIFAGFINVNFLSYQLKNGNQETLLSTSQDQERTATRESPQENVMPGGESLYRNGRGGGARRTFKGLKKWDCYLLGCLGSNAPQVELLRYLLGY